jgi:hypothetical protein
MGLTMQMYIRCITGMRASLTCMRYTLPAYTRRCSTAGTIPGAARCAAPLPGRAIIAGGWLERDAVPLPLHGQPRELRDAGAAGAT